MPPARLRSLLEEALRHHNAGRLDEAERLYARVRTADPRNFDALHLSGLVLHQQHRHAEAADRLRRALRLDPTSAVCEMRLGAALNALGDHRAAEPHLERAARRAPDLPEAWFHLGLTRCALGQVAGARAALERARSLRPNYPEALEHLGALLSRCEGFEAAVPVLRRWVAVQPASAQALANLGVALAQTNGRDEALALFDHALALDPDHLLAHTGRALVLQETYRLAEAVEAYGRALQVRPTHHEARSGRLFTLHYLDGVSREQLHAEHQAFAAALPAPAPFPGRPAPDPARPLRVGFLSPDFRAHSVAYFIAPLLEHLDPEQFEVVLYHDHPRVDAMTERFRARAALWRHTAGLPADVVEATIRADAPDLLVDLAGHTGLNRLPLFARRLAPVQVTYLGYPDTTGIPAMDYRLVDAVSDPEGEGDRFHSETLCRFAPTAWCYAPPAAAAAPAPAPSAAAGFVTFGCFNNFSKVGDATLRLWAALLAEVPGSRLLLKAQGLGSPAVAERLRSRLAACGLDPARVELLGRTPDLASHLGLYGRVDVALDTFPYHGTTTTCEALWMGVPVVTLAGDRHSSRVGASLLAAAGHPEWVARDAAGYLRIAGRLARDVAGRSLLRNALREDMARGPLLDHAGQSARFAAALRSCWAGWCAGRAAEPDRHPDNSLMISDSEPILSASHDLPALSA
jgi:predicted O-linked N-acetylglucosamine transferase (SPINDLY family)